MHLGEKVSRMGHCKRGNGASYWEHFSKTGGEGSASVCGLVTNGPRFLRTGYFVHEINLKSHTFNFLTR
jgi:hypothetical protein